MNRPIVFRAKDQGLGLWMHIFYGFKPNALDNIQGMWIELTDFNGWPLDMSTLGQWTGCRDSNGRMIFEGDVVEFAAGHTCAVRYLDNKARFDCAGRAITDWDKLTVVGTIHDDESGDEEVKG